MDFKKDYLIGNQAKEIEKKNRKKMNLCIKRSDERNCRNAIKGKVKVYVRAKWLKKHKLYLAYVAGS